MHTDWLHPKINNFREPEALEKDDTTIIRHAPILNIAQ